jgi:hypothetical protein
MPSSSSVSGDAHHLPRLRRPAPRVRAGPTAGPIARLRLPGAVRQTHTADPAGTLAFTFTIASGEQKNWNWQECTSLPPEDVTLDIHCVTKWSKLGTTWRGSRARRSGPGGVGTDLHPTGHEEGTRWTRRSKTSRRPRTTRWCAASAATPRTYRWGTWSTACVHRRRRPGSRARRPSTHADPAPVLLETAKWSTACT